MPFVCCSAAAEEPGAAVGVLGHKNFLAGGRFGVEKMAREALSTGPGFFFNLVSPKKDFLEEGGKSIVGDEAEGGGMFSFFLGMVFLDALFLF